MTPKNLLKLSASKHQSYSSCFCGRALRMQQSCFAARGAWIIAPARMPIRIRAPGIWLRGRADTRRGCQGKGTGEGSYASFAKSRKSRVDTCATCANPYVKKIPDQSRLLPVTALTL